MTRHTFYEPWFELQPTEAEVLGAQVRQEIPSEHALFGQALTALARRRDCDDVLFSVDTQPDRFALVHLTWRSTPAADGAPQTRFFDSFEDFRRSAKEAPTRDETPTA